jgi:solute carrier family 25 protein 33/36
MSAAFLTNPLDVLKTRLQSDFYQSQLVSRRKALGIPPPSSLPLHRAALLHVRETFHILTSIPRIEGARALFKGLGPNLIGVVPARAINFWTYGNGKKVISREFNGGKEAAWVHLCSAATAGMVTGTATCPIWVVKTRLQLDKSHAERVVAATSNITKPTLAAKAAPTTPAEARRYKNALDCTLQTFRAEGIRGLYRGLGASYLGVAESTLQWVLYEQMKLSLAARETRIAASGRAPTSWDTTVSLVGKMGAAGAAKLFAAVVTYPHEVVRTRLRQAPVPVKDSITGQVMKNTKGEVLKRPKYSGILQCVRLILKEEGVAALYGGLVPHMMRVVPSAAIMFGCYEGILRWLGGDSGV